MDTAITIPGDVWKEGGQRATPRTQRTSSVEFKPAHTRSLCLPDLPLVSFPITSRSVCATRCHDLRTPILHRSLPTAETHLLCKTSKHNNIDLEHR